ncbi:MAG: type IV secretion system protein [Alphaproteobacteria bacterium]|nr:type IV secretion system protein [Alphaproteobacteria bacterium]
MRNIKYIIILSLLLLVSSCNNLPSSWEDEDAFNPASQHSIEYDENFVYVSANNASWTDSGTSYNSTYSAIINVFENTPSYPVEGNGKFQGIASGTISLCKELREGIKERHHKCTSSWFGLEHDCRTWYTQITPDVYYRSCFYTNGLSLYSGQPGSGNDGKVEYIISNIKPEDSATGTVLTGTVPFEGEERPGAVIQNSQDGKIWFKIIDSSNQYYDNIGRYKVIIRQPKSSSGPTSFLSKYSKLVIEPITKQIDYVSSYMFETGTHSERFKNIIRVALVLYIILYGFTFIMGYENFTHRDFIGRIIKVSIIFILISDRGIDFFNDYLFDLFRNGQKELINAISDPTLVQVETGKLNYDSLFGFADYAMTHIFSSHFFSILVAFLLWFPVGWVCMIMILYAVVVYVFAILEVMILYIISYTAIGLMIALGPIFIPLLLFDRTRHLFDGWIAVIVSYTMQPVIMFAGIMLITTFINDTIYSLLNLKLKATAIIPIFIDFGDLGKLHLFSIYWLNPISPTLQVLTDIIIFYIFIDLLKKVSTLAGDLSSYIFGKTWGASGLAAGMAGSIKNGLATAVGMPIAGYNDYKNREGSKSRKGATKDASSKTDANRGISVSAAKGSGSGGDDGIAVSGDTEN